MDVKNNEASRRFEAEVNGRLGILDYRQSPGLIRFTHAEVPPELRGKGLASQITRAGLEYARENQLGVVPICPFVAAYIRRHPEYRDLVPEAHRHFIDR